MKRFFLSRTFVAFGLASLCPCWQTSSLAAGNGPNGPPQNPNDPIVNKPSKFEITVDGKFTDFTPGSDAGGFEWSDITPKAFISPNGPDGELKPVSLSDLNKNSLLYAGLAPGVSHEEPNEGLELYLMYDYLPRKNPKFTDSEFVAEIAFPLTIDDTVFEHSRVVIKARNPNSSPTVNLIPIVTPPSFFDIFVDLNNNGNLQDAEDFGIEGAVGFGPSPLLSDVPHLLIELEVPLLIPQGFSDDPRGPLPPGGQDGVYSPDPAFWGANIANDAVDPPASSAIFQILPNGNTVITAPRTAPDTLAWWTAPSALGMILLLGRRFRVRS